MQPSGHSRKSPNCGWQNSPPGFKFCQFLQVLNGNNGIYFVRFYLFIVWIMYDNVCKAHGPLWVLDKYWLLLLCFWSQMLLKLWILYKSMSSIPFPICKVGCNMVLELSLNSSNLELMEKHRRECGKNRSKFLTSVCFSRENSGSYTLVCIRSTEKTFPPFHVNLFITY